LLRTYKKEAYKDGSVERKVAEEVLKAGKREVTKAAVYAILDGARDLLHMLATGKIVDGQRDFVVDYA
jgi:hypothetical protein